MVRNIGILTYKIKIGGSRFFVGLLDIRLDNEPGVRVATFQVAVLLRKTPPRKASCSLELAAGLEPATF